MSAAGAPIIGREEELRRLRAAWTRARGGFGGVVVVSGEPGIGKTTLVDVIAGEIAKDGGNVARGRAWEAGVAPAYFPLWPCLRALGLPPIEAAGDDFRRWEEVLAALARASSEQPIVWVVEDLHAADAQTLDLLTFVSHPARSLALLVLVTTRDADPRLDEPKLRRIARIARDAEQILLAPLDREQVAALVKSRFAAVPDALVDELVQRTAGNPLFVAECSRGFATAGDLRFVKLPQTLRSSVLERVELLPTATRAVLDDAAVLGDEAFSGVLARMGKTQPATVIDALAPAVRAGILVELAPGRFRFTHALVREVLHDALAVDTRVLAHARAAEALDTRDAIVDRARHALASLRPGAESEVRATVDAAIARLVADGTHDRALQLFEGVLAACARGELPDASVADLLQGAGLAHATGNYALARTRCLEAIALARTNGDGAGLADAALALGADLRPGSVDRVLVRALEEAQAALADRDEVRACRLAVRRAAAMQPATDRWAPVHVARAAIAQARTLGDAVLLREVMLLGGAAMIDVAPHTETRALAAELRELCEAAGDIPGLMRASARLIVDELTLGDLFAFDAHLDALLGLARSVGTPRLVWRPLLLASMRACMRGDIALSDRLTTEVEQLAALTDDPALAMSMPAHALTRAFALGRRSEVEMMLAGLERYDVPNMEWLRLHLQMQYAHAFRDREVAAQVVAAQGSRLAVLCGPHGAVVGAVVALGGSAAQCREHADLLADEADHHVVEGHIPFAYGGSLRAVIAALEAGAGRADVAERHYRDALAIADTHGLRPWAARIRLELGELVHDDELVRAAAEQAEALGLQWLAGEARRSLAPGPVATPIVRVGAALTMTRDGEVWRVAFGDRDVRIANARGLELLARLVERPSDEIHVLALAGDAGAPAPESDAGELLDARAIESYRARLAKLAERIEDAHGRADGDRALRLEREQETLERELARAVGLGGRRRTAGSTSERARINVQRRLKDAIDRVERADAEIGAYLRAAVRTGTYCTFRP